MSNRSKYELRPSEIGKVDIFEGAKKVGGAIHFFRTLPIIGEVIGDIPGVKESEHITGAITESEKEWDRAKAWLRRDGSTYSGDTGKASHEVKTGHTQPSYVHSGVQNWSSNKNAIALM